MVALVGKRKPNRARQDVFSGAKLREQRLAKELTQASLAEQADVHVIDVSRYERDEVEPSLGVAVRLAKILGVDVTDLLKDE